MSNSRRILFAAATVVICLLAMWPLLERSQDDPADEPGRSQINLRRFLADRADEMHSDDPYRPPTARERRVAGQAIESLLDQPEAVRSQVNTFSSLGMRFTTGRDAETGREFLMANTPMKADAPWGTILIDRTAPPNVVIEVPHPRADRDTEEVGAQLFQNIPGSILIMAGSHRRTGDEAGDVAHRTDSMFHVFASRLMSRGLPQLQLHGFDSGNLPDTDAIISPGAGVADENIERIADGLEAAGFEECRAWEKDCGDLEGTKNVQGVEAAQRRVPFIHLELTRRLRSDADEREKLVDALSTALINRN